MSRALKTQLCQVAKAFTIIAEWVGSDGRKRRFAERLLEQWVFHGWVCSFVGGLEDWRQPSGVLSSAAE